MNSHARMAQPPAGQTPFDTLTEALGGAATGVSTGMGVLRPGPRDALTPAGFAAA
jgi:hypothetical protein